MENYLSDEHRHAETDIWPDTRLHAELLKRVDQLKQPYYNEERRRQIGKAVRLIVFEQERRYLDTHPDIDSLE